MRENQMLLRMKCSSMKMPRKGKRPVMRVEGSGARERGCGGIWRGIWFVCVGEVNA